MCRININRRTLVHVHAISVATRPPYWPNWPTPYCPTGQLQVLLYSYPYLLVRSPLHTHVHVHSTTNRTEPKRTELNTVQYSIHLFKLPRRRRELAVALERRRFARGSPLGLVVCAAQGFRCLSSSSLSLSLLLAFSFSFE